MKVWTFREELMQYTRGIYLSDAESQDARIFKKVAERSPLASVILQT
jgi:hypothetical protein